MFLGGREGGERAPARMCACMRMQGALAAAAHSLDGEAPSHRLLSIVVARRGRHVRRVCVARFRGASKSGCARPPSPACPCALTAVGQPSALHKWVGVGTHHREGRTGGRAGWTLRASGGPAPAVCVCGCLLAWRPTAPVRPHSARNGCNCHAETRVLFHLTSCSVGEDPQPAQLKYDSNDQRAQG